VFAVRPWVRRSRPTHVPGPPAAERVREHAAASVRMLQIWKILNIRRLDGTTNDVVHEYAMMTLHDGGRTTAEL